MKHEWLDDYLCSKKDAKKDNKEEWEATLYMLQGKMFALQGKNKDGRAIITFKLDPSPTRIIKATAQSRRHSFLRPCEPELP